MTDTTILTALISPVSVLLGIWLGSHVNRKAAIDTARQLVEVEGQKHAQSRLWDAKKDAYTEIVAHLNGIHKDIEYTLDRLFDPDVDPQPYIDSADYTKDCTELWKRITALNITLANSSLIVSNEFTAAIGQWHVEFVAYGEDDEPRGVITTQSNATNKHRPIIIQLAKDELAAIPKG